MEINTDSKKISELLERGVEEVIDKDNLAKKLVSGKQLRVKFGIDPTAADIHLGHSVGLGKLRQFQELGHKAILIIGDFTTLIGDPSGRTTSRPALTSEQIRDNMKDYISQAAKVIDIDRAEIHYNSEWFGNKPMSFLMDLAGRFTVARLIEREDFQKRLRDGLDVTMLEMLYPLLQGYDSVACRADVELGGYDQRLNLLFARRVQKKFGQEEQEVMMVPLLIGIDGEKKMSKSVGNYIGLNEEPARMFSRVMMIGDNLMWDYFKLLTRKSQAEIDELKKDTESGKIHPRDAKMKLAYEILGVFLGKEAAEGAQMEFVKVAQEGQLPSEMPEIEIGDKEIGIMDLLVKLGATNSKGEAKRLVAQNGVKIDGVVKNDWKEAVLVKAGMVVQVGRRGFFKVK